MSSNSLDMSLDEIIKNSNERRARKPGRPNFGKYNKQAVAERKNSFPPKSILKKKTAFRTGKLTRTTSSDFRRQPFTKENRMDARTRIMQKRGRPLVGVNALNQKKPVDARIKIESKRIGKNRIARVPVGGSELSVTTRVDSGTLGRRRKDYICVEEGDEYEDLDMVVDDEELEPQPDMDMHPLRRTVVNDLARRPLTLADVIPVGSQRSSNSILRTVPNEPVTDAALYENFTRTIENDAQSPIRSARAKKVVDPRPVMPEPMQYARLERRVNKSEGYKVLVSNLHRDVTCTDIKELFEEMGPLVASRIVDMGTAEVIFKFEEDARRALEAYDNRLLDGQPMRCLLVKPSRSSNVRKESSEKLKTSLSSSTSHVKPSLFAVRKALFKR